MEKCQRSKFQRDWCIIHSSFFKNIGDRYCNKIQTRLDEQRKRKEDDRIPTNVQTH